MKPFSVLFDGKSQILYNDKLVSRYYLLDEPGEYLISFRFISTNSKFNQAIVMIFNEFIGSYFLFDEEVQIPRIRFPKENFWADTSPSEIRIKINLISGRIYICNGSDPLGTKQICHALHMGCAMCVNKTSDNVYRFHCNDHENDDDFDDLVFEMKIITRL